MSIQIAVRLADETVEFIDRMVKTGRAGSRAEVLVRALAREERRERALKDLEILSKDSEDEFAAMREFVARTRTAVD